MKVIRFILLSVIFLVLSAFGKVVLDFISTSRNNGSTVAVLAESHKQLGENQYPFRIKNCPERLLMTVPEGFSPAKTADEYVTQEVILESLHSNKARKAIYSKVFMKDWSAIDNIPYIAVATLGSVLEFQGQIDDEIWSGLKKEFSMLKASPEKAFSILKQKEKEYIQGSDQKISVTEARDPLIYEQDAENIVIIIKMGFEMSDKMISVYSVSKFTHAGSCLVFTQMATPVNSQHAVESVRELATQTDISVRG